MAVHQSDLSRVPRMERRPRLSGSPFAFFESVKEGSQLFQGVTNRTLMMGETRDFHDAGRFLERADQTARILDVKYHDLLPAIATSDRRSRKPARLAARSTCTAGLRYSNRSARLKRSARRSGKA